MKSNTTTRDDLVGDPGRADEFNSKKELLFRIVTQSGRLNVH